MPWLCAYSGARVGEIGQLSAGNILKETAPDGTAIWCMRFTPEDGSIKTDEARTVPIHPHVIEHFLRAMIAPAFHVKSGQLRNVAFFGKAHQHPQLAGPSLVRLVSETVLVPL